VHDGAERVHLPRHVALEEAALHERVVRARHVVIGLDLRALGGSALTGDAEVPKNRGAEAMATEIPVTYVPARNIILLSLALAWCEALGADDTYIGVNAVDYSGYPDCRPAFIEQFQRLAGVSTKAGVERKARFFIHAPLIEMSKSQIILAGHKLGVDFSLTHSCNDPAEDGGACGSCDSCVLRRRGFAQAGIPDPTRYAA
jgi:7-cyano-7-deazaguanine synthase